MKTYEALFIFPSRLRDEEIDKAVEAARQEIVKLGGQITGTKFIGKKPFARSMKKHDAGFYVRVGLWIEPSEVDALRKRYRLSENVFRVQITTVDPADMVIDPPPEQPAATEAGAAEA